MKIDRNVKPHRALPIILLCIVLALSVPLSWAKLARRLRYPLDVGTARPVVFEGGREYRFEVPHSGYYALQLWGGAGGDSLNVWSGDQVVYPTGGPGGYVAATAYFEAGTVLDIIVGSSGGILTGGFNGGGWGGSLYEPIFNDYFGGGGGGATDIRPEGGGLADRILVAGGGGGGSGGTQAGDGTGEWPAMGGAGGGLDSGLDGQSGAGGGPGWGGTPEGGGEGAHWGREGQGGDGAYSGGGGGGAYSSAGGGGGGGAFVAEGLASAPDGLPGREIYPGDARDGLVVMVYLGNYLGDS